MPGLNGFNLVFKKKKDMEVGERLVARRELKDVGRDKQGELRGNWDKNTLYRCTKLSKNKV